MDKGKFILTMDNSVADKLLAKGFQMVSAIDNYYIFINIGQANFSDNMKKKITYTDILSF